MAKFAWHGRERLGLLRVRDDAIVLHAMRWDDEIRDPSSPFPDPVDLSEDEIREVLRLVEGIELEDLQGPEFTDRYTEALEQVIDAKRQGRKPPAAPEPEAPGEVVDLMATLEQSVAKARASRGEGEATVHDMPAKKTAAKKPAKKALAKEAAAGKPTAKKTTSKSAGKKTTARKTAAKKAQRTA